MENNKISNTPNDSDIGYFVEYDLKHPDNMKEETKYSPFGPENKLVLNIYLVFICMRWN